MSNKHKLQRFAELSGMSHVFENQEFEDPHVLDVKGQRLDLKGNWKNNFNNNLARSNPSINYIGVDIKGARIWKGATIAIKEHLTNVAFLRTRIEMISSFFAPAEVSEIWITFPDPFLRDSKSNRRLTSEPFLQRYRQILKPGAVLHLKTDDETLFDFSLETIRRQSDFELEESTFDFYGEQNPVPETTLLTYYERRHLLAGKKIKYLRAKFLVS